MKKISILFISILCLSFLVSCEKDETKAVLSSAPVAPTIAAPSANIVMTRAQSSTLLVFKGAAADFGFDASVTYTLQADLATGNFAEPVNLASGMVDTFSFKASELNTMLLTMGLIEDVATPVKMRVAANVLSSVPTVYSTVSTVNFTVYGLPKLVLSTAVSQKVVSPAGDGIFKNFIYLSADEPFTVTDPETGKVYGGVGGVLSEGGAAINGLQGGWNLTVNLNDMTYLLAEATIGIIGSATPTGWDNDTPMTYDFSDKSWNITIDLIAGMFKFRSHGSWGGDYNLGLGDATHPDYNINNLWNNGGSVDIPLPADGPGSYTVKLFVHSGPFKCVMTKN